MKNKAFFPLVFAAVFLFAALSTGSPVLLLISVLLWMALLLGLLGVFWVVRTLRLSLALDPRAIVRGEPVRLEIRLRHSGWIPVAPLVLELASASGEAPKEIRLRDIPGRLQTLAWPFSASHVGSFSVGVRACRVEDLMGFFQLTRKFDLSDTELLVLPAVFHTEPLALSPGDPGSDIMARATEDLSAPSDIRNYQFGDPMKKIHWKLSLRKQDLLVRRFDEPVLQDVLMLMDCSRPPSWGHSEAEADIRDALLETAASVFRDQELTDLSVHLPLFGQHPVELEKSMGLPLILENLARADFSETDRFERVLLLESRRLRKVGCLIVISARLNSQMVDILIRMRHMGPNIRLYLITFAPEDARVLRLVSRLQQSAIQVSYVTPDSAQ